MAKQGTATAGGDGAASEAGPISGNAGGLLYYGDNLDILRRYVDDESIDLIYLDPPFKSNADYSVLFGEREEEEDAELH